MIFQQDVTKWHYYQSLTQEWKDCNLRLPAAISAHSHSADWQQAATVTQRRTDRDGWIDRRMHTRPRLLINSCRQRANTLGSSVEMSVMLAISLHAFQVGCPQPVTVGYQGKPTRSVTCQNTFLSLVRNDSTRCQSRLLCDCTWQGMGRPWYLAVMDK